MSLFKIDNFKDYLTTSFGVAIAQAIALLSIPFIANSVGPEVFGEYSYYFSLITIICVFASLKLELSVFTLKPELFQVLKSFLVIWIPISSLLISSIVIAFIKSPHHWVYIILNFSFLTCSITLFEFLQQENIKNGLFKNNALMRIYRAIFVVPVFVVLDHFIKDSSLVVLLSFASANLTSALTAQKIVFKPAFFKLAELKFLFKETQSTVLYMTPAHFLNRYSANALLLLAGVYNSGMANIGLLALAYKLLIAPISIVTSANASVLKREVYVAPKKALLNFAKISFISLLLGVFSALLFSLYSENLIVMFLGEEWIGILDYMKALFPYCLVLLTLSPITHVYVVLSKQKYDFYWQIFNAVFITISIFFGLKIDFITGVWFFSISISLSILLSSAICVYFVLKHEPSVSQSF